MRTTMFLLAGLCTVVVVSTGIEIVKQIAAIERAALERDAVDETKASMRLQHRAGSLFTNATTVRKSRSMARVRRSTDR
jgi:hypothetical protein